MGSRSVRVLPGPVYSPAVAERDHDRTGPPGRSFGEGVPAGQWERVCQRGSGKEPGPQSVLFGAGGPVLRVEVLRDRAKPLGGPGTPGAVLRSPTRGSRGSGAGKAAERPVLPGVLTRIAAPNSREDRSVFLGQIQRGVTVWGGGGAPGLGELVGSDVPPVVFVPRSSSPGVAGWVRSGPLLSPRVFCALSPQPGAAGGEAARPSWGRGGKGDGRSIARG